MSTAPQWVFGPFRLDPDHACLWCEAQAVVLPPKVFAVLHYLVTHPDRLVTKDELLEAVWGWTFGDQSTVTVHVRRLREKIENDPANPTRIVTVWGVGYRFESAGRSAARATNEDSRA